MTELTEQEQQKLNTGRMMRAESDLLLPLLQTKQAAVLGKIVYSFKAGKHEELIALAAELSTLSDMKSEITRKIKEAESLERKMINGNE